MTGLLNMNTLQKALEEIVPRCSCDFHIRSYSGRGMYGKNCLAITGDNLNPTEIGFELGLYAEANGVQTDILRAIRRMRSDSMGLGIVLYWPGVPFNGDDFNDDDEEIW